MSTYNDNIPFKIRPLSKSLLRPVPTNYTIEVIQQPNRARACGIARLFAGRRTIDPPPVVKLSLWDSTNHNIIERTINHLILFASLEYVTSGTGSQGIPELPTSGSEGEQASKKRKKSQTLDTEMLCGEIAVAATIINPEVTDFYNDELRGFFVFNDLSVRYEGNYRLVFTLYEFPLSIGSIPTIDVDKKSMGKLAYRSSVKSDLFRVYTAKEFPGLTPSTQLDHALKNLGSKIRIRKITGTKRGSTGSRKVRNDILKYDNERNDKQKIKNQSPKNEINEGTPTTKASLAPKISNLLNHHANNTSNTVDQQNLYKPPLPSSILGPTKNSTSPQSLPPLPSILPSYSSYQHHRTAPIPPFNTYNQPPLLAPLQRNPTVGTNPADIKNLSHIGSPPFNFPRQIPHINFNNTIHKSNPTFFQPQHNLPGQFDNNSKK